MKLEEDNALLRTIFRVFVDPWIAMLAVGALGHRLHDPRLLHIDYWSWVLIVIVIQALWGTDHPDYKLTFKKDKK